MTKIIFWEWVVKQKIAWKKIRGSTEYLLVGIDVAKDRHHAFYGTTTEKTLFKRLVFENDLEGFRKLLIQAEAVRVQQGLKKEPFNPDYLAIE